MKTAKMTSGGEFPPIEVPLVSGGSVRLDKVTSEDKWKAIFVYRGIHCPLCINYLSELNQIRDNFTSVNSEVIAVSADTFNKAKRMVEENNLNFPVAYDLSISQMQELGLYISNPRSPEETDRPFAEPATFVINSEKKVHLIDMSNTPFNRAEISELYESIKWIQENSYPIRGTYQY